MKVPPCITLLEARDLAYKLNGFPADGGVSKNRWSPIAFGGFKVYLPNFRWRRKAIPFHDLHHILTGYEFSPEGEFQMAAWEFAAGRYPSIYATLFCIPLVGMGAFLIPKKQFTAFVRGRRSRTLYHEYDYDETLRRLVGEMRSEILPESDYKPSLIDIYEYTKLVCLSVCAALLPLALTISIISGVL